MSIYNLSDNRMLCWDDFAIEKQENVEIVMHKPTPREIAIESNAQWEGIHNHYASVEKVGDKYYFWQRCETPFFNENCYVAHIFPDCPIVYTLHESLDGKTFKKKWIDKHEFNGKLRNNIVLAERLDNFAVCLDTNPNCATKEKFKAFGMLGSNHELGHGLGYWVSEDGIDFVFKGKLKLPGSFDSFNIAFWDEDIGKYRLYYRGERRRPDEEFDLVNKSNNIVREIRTATTTDFETFDVHGEIDYGEGKDIMQLYTNNTVKYPRAKGMYIAFPGRYVERWNSDENLRSMPLSEMRGKFLDRGDRTATGITDTLLMTSRDGVKFNRFDEAFLKPYSEYRWWYGDGWCARGIWETESDVENAPNELSFLAVENYRTNYVNWRRYTVRLDGFVSWYAKYTGGEVLTKPFTFAGSELELNFETGAMGTLTVTVCDQDGNELEGYKSYELFGDSVDRRLKFEKSLKELEGKPIRLKFFLKDCHLYSYKFN